MPARTVHAVCSHDCPDSCGVLVSIDETGRATNLRGDPEHPVTRGFLCAKVTKYLDRVYSPDRLLYPMRRRADAPKGSLPAGHEAEFFERISWDEALDTIAARLAAISAEHGPESILPYSYAGTIGVLNYGSMDRRFFHRLGASQLLRTICAETGGEALKSVYGRKLGTDPEAFPHARLIIAWAANIHGNNVHLWPFIEEARRNGAKLVVIDPFATRTARAADWHIPIRPGTDSALALGLIHLIVRKDLYDHDYVERWTHGFEQLRQRVAVYTPEYVSSITGILAEDIIRLAREYAAAKPAVIRVNYGVQRADNGGAAVRAIAMLPALIGAWKHYGGGLQLSTSGAFRFDNAALERPDLMLSSPLGRVARSVNMSTLGHALNDLGRDNSGRNHSDQRAEDGPPVHALFVYNSNPAAVAPDQASVLRGMARHDLFMVVHEQFFTDTADYADIVLPATTFFEHKDIQGAYGHYYVQLSDASIEPLGEARSNVWLFSQLAQRMGFTEPCFRDTPDDLIAQALRVDDPAQQDPWLAGITQESLRADGGMKRLQFAVEQGGDQFLPFAEGPFPTPSGKIEFYSEALEAAGGDPLPAFRPAAESRHTANGQYPLEFLPRKADNYMNSTFANLATHQKFEAAHSGVLEMHETDARTRGIADGDAVDVFNDRGSLRLRAHVNGGIASGVVAARLGWNKLSASGHNVNLLTSQRLNDLAGGPVFYSVLVEVRKAEGAQTAEAAD
jgi:molybdopterin guanine dinucleotide-containing S/N-oxide reductase-like protein